MKLRMPPRSPTDLFNSDMQLELTIIVENEDSTFRTEFLNSLDLHRAYLVTFENWFINNFVTKPHRTKTGH